MIEIDSIWDWVDGRRMKVVAIPFPGTSAIYLLEDCHGKLGNFYGHEILQLGFPTKLQIGQTWSHKAVGLVIKLVDFLPPGSAGHRWSVREEDRPDSSPQGLDEIYISSAYWLIDLAPPPLGHGTQTCPRCGSGGALILMNLVACINEKCPCYSTKDVLVP